MEYPSFIEPDEPDSLLPCLQEPTNGLYRVPVQSSPHRHTQFL